MATDYLLNYYEVGLGNDYASRLRDLAWRLRSGDVISYDFETVSLLDQLVIELEEYKDQEYDYDSVFSIIGDTFDDDDMKRLIKDIRHDLKITDRINKNITKEDSMDKVIEWYNMSTKELKVELENKNLKVSGSKKDLVERLKEDWLSKYD